SSVFRLPSLVPPLPALSPYTTLFRSALDVHRVGVGQALVVGPADDTILRDAGNKSGPVLSVLAGPSAACAAASAQDGEDGATFIDRKSTRLNYSHVSISYAVFCLKSE